MAAIEFVVRARPRRTFAVQVLRGIGWTVALLTGLWLVATLLTAPGGPGIVAWNDVDGDTINIHPQWNAIFIVAAVAALSIIAFRLIGRWAARPRWLRPVGAVAVLLAAVFAAAPFHVSRDSIAHKCMPLVDAWHRVVAKPPAADLHVWSSAYNMQFSPYHDLARTQAFYRAQARRSEALQATPAFRRADRYVTWVYSQAACAPEARAQLARSGAVLAGSGVLIAAAAWLTTKKRQHALLKD